MHQLRNGNAVRTDDPRDPLERMRRRELEAVLRDNNMSHPKDIPANAAREILRSAGVTGHSYIGPHGEFVWPEEVDAGDDYDPSAALGKAVGDMTIQELRTTLKRIGIAWNLSENKKTLQKKLNAYIEQRLS